MSFAETENDFRLHVTIRMNGEDDGRFMQRVVNSLAYRAHRLAQPTPKVDADAEAKRMAWEYEKAAQDIIQPIPNEHNRMQEHWDHWLTESKRNGWRAVAAAKKDSGR